MTRQVSAVARRRAELHAAAAHDYRRNADALRQQGEHPSAGALLYEAAKSCINAVANRQGRNPVKTTAKFQFLQALAASVAAGDDLLDGWRAANCRHIHADQLHLDDDAFSTAWDTTQAFIAEMLNTPH